MLTMLEQKETQRDSGQRANSTFSSSSPSVSSPSFPSNVSHVEGASHPESEVGGKGQVTTPFSPPYSMLHKRNKLPTKKPPSFSLSLPPPPPPPPPPLPKKMKILQSCPCNESSVETSCSGYGSRSSGSSIPTNNRHENHRTGGGISNSEEAHCSPTNVSSFTRGDEGKRGPSSSRDTNSNPQCKMSTDVQDLQRGTFQRKFRLWFGSSKKKSSGSTESKESPSTASNEGSAPSLLDQASRLRSLSTPALNVDSQNLPSSSTNLPPLTSALSMGTFQRFTDICDVEGCTCNQEMYLPSAQTFPPQMEYVPLTVALPSPVDQPTSRFNSNEASSSRMQRNLKTDFPSEKLTSKEFISQTLPKNFNPSTLRMYQTQQQSNFENPMGQLVQSITSPPTSCPSVEDQYVVVVSDLQSFPSQLTVRTDPNLIGPSGQVSSSTEVSSSSSFSFPSSSVERDMDRNGPQEVIHRHLNGCDSHDQESSLSNLTSERVGSSEMIQDYKSSSASESGRGTLTSEPEVALRGNKLSTNPLLQNEIDAHNPGYGIVSPSSPSTSPPLHSTCCQQEVTYAKPSPPAGHYYKSKYPQLYVASNRAPMPPVVESESWVSDCSTAFRDVVGRKGDKSSNKHAAVTMMGPASLAKVVVKGPKGLSAPALDKKLYAPKAGTRGDGKSTKNSSSSKKGVHSSYWKTGGTRGEKEPDDPSTDDSFDQDDGCSEFTADLSTVYDREKRGDRPTFKLEHHIRDLHNTYEELISKLLHRSSGSSRPSGLRRRKLMGSVSTVNSIVSRGGGGGCAFSEKRFHKRNNTKGTPDTTSQQLKRMEEHVTTLAKGVGQLSCDMRENQKLREETARLRKEMALIQQQMNQVQSKLESMSVVKIKPAESIEKMYSTVNKKPSKLTRLVTGEPSPLRQFMKQLGYEKYSVIFEEERIGLDELVYFTEEKLQKLGLPMGPRIRMLQELHRIRVYNQSRSKHH